MTTHDSGWKKLYANIILVWNTGYGSVLGRFQGMINLTLLASTYMLAKGFELSFVESMIFGIGLIIFILICGFFYLKAGLSKSEFSVNVKQQPEMVQLFNDIKEIKELLKTGDKNGKI
jgi:uncharacterized membrane protein YciS (DUF1049 family)